MHFVQGPTKMHFHFIKTKMHFVQGPIYIVKRQRSLSLVISPSFALLLISLRKPLSSSRCGHRRHHRTGSWPRQWNLWLESFGISGMLFFFSMLYFLLASPSLLSVYLVLIFSFLFLFSCFELGL